MPETDAREFSTIPEAAQEALRHQNAVVVLSYRNPRCELKLDPVYCLPSTIPAPSAS